jgi:ABC-type glutathione transport system ATPase component
MNESIISLRHVTKRFSEPGMGVKRRMFTAVNDVSFDLYSGDVLGLLGESGCGKSTLARMISGLIHPTAGEIVYRGTNIEGLDDRAFRPFRREIQMVFQNPFSCLDPRMKVRSLLMEPLKLWKIGSCDGERRDRVEAVCRECGLPLHSLDKRPGEFSGGQLQRIAIARALLTEPKLLVADEIVSALDVSVQNQILQLLLDMRERHGLSLLFITHDLAVIEKMSNRVIVMRHGQILQQGTCHEVLYNSTDPYVITLRKYRTIRRHIWRCLFRQSSDAAFLIYRQ